MASAYIGRVDRTWTRAMVWVAIAGLVAIDALYLAIIYAQGGPDPPDVLTVPFVATYLAVMALILGASLLSAGWAKAVLRAAASGGLVVLGVIAAFSIGVLILVVAAVSMAATVPVLNIHAKVLVASGLAAVVAAAVLVAGLEYTSHYIVCPATGGGSGTTGGLFSHVAYQCDEGVLTTR